MNFTATNPPETRNRPADELWRFWPLVPLYPYRKRRTLRTEVLNDTIWTFDQLQGILYTVVPIRMTVIRLSSGGLLVYAPVAPTRECLRLISELVDKYGEVKYILLPTSSGLEHKVFVGPFARCFPNAQVYVAPSQWSFPFNLPLSWLGFPANRTQVLPENSALTPFAHEFDYEILNINLGRGSFVEVALHHKPTRTLLVTDIVLSVPDNPPAIAQLDPYPLLFHARDNALEVAADTASNRRKGWQRIALFAVYFQPSTLETVSLSEAFQDARQAPDKSKKAYFGLYPFRWQKNWQQSFDALRGDGRPFVAPILQTLILDHDPQQTLNWANRVASWDFQWIIPCHLDAPILTTPQQFRQAFNFLENQSESGLLPAADLAFVRQLEENLNKWGITNPPLT